MTPKAKKYLQAALRLLVSAAALLYVLSNTDLKSLGLLLRNSNVWLLVAALFLFAISKVLSAYRLNVFLRATGIILTESANLKLYMLGMYYNLFLPGGIGGDGYKVYYLKRNKGASIKQAITVILFDRVTGVLALIFMCILLVSFVPEVTLSVFMAFIAAILLIAAFYITVKKFFSIFYAHLHLTNIQSIGVQISQLVCALLILSALGEDHHIMTYLFVFLISSVVAIIPFTIGGIGARELTFLYAARLLNLDITVSVSLSLLFFLITALVSMSGLPFSIRPEFIKSSDS